MKRFWPLFTSLFFILLLVFYLSSRVLEFFSPYLPYAPYLLGIDRPTSYLVLLGNDAEMRANGGFAGSYAKIVLTSPRLDSLSSRVLEFFLKTRISKPSATFEFQDIYVPNGQIKGLYVKPPEPVQQAFGHGTWELANADWEPDFPSAARDLRWFFEKGGEINPDNLVILNLSTIKKVLSLVGSFEVPEYQATLTPDNLYQFLQGKVELNFFPGSTQKKDTLTAVGHALIKKIRALGLIQKIKIAQILYTDLKNQNIVVHSTNSSFQSFLEQEKLAGVFQPEALDTYSLIETNLGANKANAYVTRETDHQISFANSQIHHSINIKFVNSSPEANPNPPLHYGGNYIAYLRLYIPKEATNIKLDHQVATTSSTLAVIPGSDPESIPQCEIPNVKCKISFGLTELGFWHITLAGNQSTVSLSYDLPLADQKAYTLAILKQHGQLTSPQTVNLFDKAYTTPLENDFYLPLKIQDL